MTEPLALTLYRRYRSGESIIQIAAAVGLTIQAVQVRVRHAALYYARTSTQLAA